LIRNSKWTAGGGVFVGMNSIAICTLIINTKHIMLLHVLATERYIHKQYEFTE